jgi:hypothetical protein
MEEDSLHAEFSKKVGKYSSSVLGYTFEGYKIIGSK